MLDGKIDNKLAFSLFNEQIGFYTNSNLFKQVVENNIQRLSKLEIEMGITSNFSRQNTKLRSDSY